MVELPNPSLSIVIPAHNEEGHIAGTVLDLHATLKSAGITHEILVVNDHSNDTTGKILKELEIKVPNGQFRSIENLGPGGFGFAVRTGLDHFRGDVVAIVMADASDLPADVVNFYRTLENGFECVFGSRFMPQSRIVDYPWPKLILNRFANLLIQVLFQMKYNDVTNAFKMYRRHVIQGLKPFLSHHFNLTVELPLKAIVRGYRFSVVPNSWINRKAGVSKFKIKEMGSRYLFIMIYCFIEKWLSRGDYYRKSEDETPGNAARTSGPANLK